jgi:hypothetical protein
MGNEDMEFDVKQELEEIRREQRKLDERVEFIEARLRAIVGDYNEDSY